MSDETFTPNIFVNQSISFDAVEKVIDRLKTKKAVGIDLIPNEVLKSHDVKMILYTYFTKFFEFNKIPTLWLKSLIKPIPKSSCKDPLVPLNYRAISLLSCIYKVYSGILNNRLVLYFEDLNWFADEQNGFRNNRSCQDHNYILNSIVENRQSEKWHTYAAFVDMQTAFDWLERLAHVEITYE